MTDTDKWDLDREPSKLEKHIGSIAAAVGSVVLGLLTVIGWYVIIQDPNLQNQGQIVFSIIVTALFLFTSFLFFRITFGKRESMSARSQLIIGIVIVIACLLLMMGILINPPSNPFMPFAVAFVGMSAGVKGVLAARKKFLIG
jgi:hypothetical protein